MHSLTHEQRRLRVRVTFTAACLLCGLAVLRGADTPPPAVVIGGKAKTADKAAAEKASHPQQSFISVRGSDGQGKLATLSVDGEGRVLALVAPPRSYGATVKNATSEVQVFSGEGKKLLGWKVSFHAHSINAAADGTIYVAGDGKVAKFDKAGKSLGEIELPHIKKLLASKEALKKQAAAQIKQQQESFATIIKRYKDMKEQIEKVEAEKRTDLQKRQLQQYDSILKSYATTENYYKNLSVDTVVNQITSRLRIINSVAVSEKDVFIACGATKGFGYAVWRMDHEFKNPKEVLSGLGGCCGQMDVEVSGSDLIVAENTRHQFARYDRDGKKLGSFGKQGKETDSACFGGCCNPMNVRSGAGGDVYTAESEGIIKRFNAKGEFVGLVGHAPLTGGCKNVAVGVSPDATKVYFCDLPGSRIVVLTKKAVAAASE